MQPLGAEFDIKDMPLDAEVLRSAAADVKDQLPILQTAQTRELRGGIPTMTADGHHILGPAPGIEGFYFASGCNVSGLSIAPTVGEALAAWIVDGQPPVDLTPMSAMRFKGATWNEHELRRDAAWQYRHFYGAV
jgi:4-methylaminobutanoate oxidase (formaldehyde-forming)